MSAANDESRSTAGLGVCGAIHSDGMPRDMTGCLLPDNHEGPHEFRAEDGTIWQWETDFECDCSHCMKFEGDYCTIYWRKTPNVEVRGG